MNSLVLPYGVCRICNEFFLCYCTYKLGTLGDKYD